MFYSPNFSHVLPCLIVAVFFAYASAEPFKILDPVDKLSCQTCCDPMVTAVNNVYQTTDAIDTISGCQQACDIFSIVDNPSFAFCSSLTSGNANRRVGCEIGRDILFANLVSLLDGFGYRCNKDNFQTVFLSSLPFEADIVENPQISDLDCQTCCSSFDGKFGSRFDAADVSSCQSSCNSKEACFVPSSVYDITVDADHRQRLGCSLAVDWLNFAETRFLQINDFNNLEFIRVGCRNGVAVDLDNNNNQPEVFGLPLGMFVGIASSVLLCCTCIVVILCCCLICQRKKSQNNQIPATIIIKALELPEARKIEMAQNVAGTEQKKTPPVVVQKPAFAAFTSMTSLRPKYLSTWMFQKKQPIELPENLQPVIMESQNQKTGIKTQQQQQQLQKSPVQTQPHNDKLNFAATATYVSSFDAGERYASPKKEVQKPNAEILRPTMPPPPKKLKQVRQESSVSEDIENQSGKMTEDDEEDDDENEAEVEKFPSEMPIPKLPKKSSLMKNTKSPKPPPKTVSKVKKMKSAEQMSETDEDEEEESEEEEEEDKEKGKSEEMGDDAPEPPPRVPKNANENEL